MKSEAPEELELRRYWRMLVQRKWLGLAVFVVVAVAGVVVVYTRPPVYSSRCVLSVERGRILERVIGAPAESASAGRIIQAVRERMLGWSPVVGVIADVGLDVGLDPRDVRALEKVYTELRKNTTVRTLSENYIEIKFQGDRPETNVRIVNGLTGRFLENVLASSRTEADRTLMFIMDEIKRVKSDLDVKATEIQRFEEQHMHELSQSESGKLATLERVENQLRDLAREIKSQSARMEYLKQQIKARSPSGSGEVAAIPGPTLDALRRQLAQREADLWTLRATRKYTDEHPDVKGILEEISILKSAISQEQSETPTGAASETDVIDPVRQRLEEMLFVEELRLEELESQKTQLESQRDKLSKEVEVIPSLRKELGDLQREHDILEARYEQLLLDQQRADVAKQASLAADIQPFTIVEPPRPSYEPEMGSTGRTLLIGSLFLAVGLAASAVFGLGALDQTLRTVDDVRQSSNLQALAIIPTIPCKQELQHRTRWVGVVIGLVVLVLVVVVLAFVQIEFLRNLLTRGVRQALRLMSPGF